MISPDQAIRLGNQLKGRTIIGVEIFNNGRLCLTLDDSTTVWLLVEKDD